MKKRILTLLMAGILVLSTLLTACGKDKEDKKDTVLEGIVYKAQYHDFTLDKNEYVSSSTVWGNDMYYLTMKYNEENMSVTTKLCKMSLTDWSVTEIPVDIQNETTVMDMFIDETGVYLITMYNKWNDDYTKLLDFGAWIMQLNAEGEEIRTLDITEDLKTKESEEGYPAYISSIVCDKEHNILVTDSDSFIMAWDKEGNKIGEIPLDTWGNGLVASEDGSVYYLGMDEMSWDNVLFPVLINEKKLGDKIGNLSGMYANDVSIDKNQVILMSAENELLMYDVKNDEEKTVLNWLDYNVNGMDIRMVRMLEDGKIMAYTESYSGDNTVSEIVVLEESDGEQEEKIILTYATFGNDSDIASAIIRFNQNSDKYRIKVVDYYDEEDWETGRNAYEEAILDGSSCDIFSVNTDEYKSFARKGLYADLSELMNNDPDVKREDYFENILKAFEVDGKLYAMPTSFNINTLVGKTAIWGEERADMKKFVEVAGKLPKDSYLMEGISKSGWLYTALMAGFDNYINWETGECSFASPEFIELLETANSFPKEYNWDSVTGSTPQLLESNKIALYTEYMSQITDYQLTKVLFGEPITNVGFPGAPGNGSIITGYSSLFAISEQCENKEGAWEFVKYMISEDYQSNYIEWSIPIHKGAFDKRMEKAMEKGFYKNEDGEEVEAPVMTYGWQDVTVEVYAATQEDVKEFRAIIEGAQTTASMDTEIMTMIEEETAPFFDGKKSAKEVADIIQGRVKIYVNEMR